MLDCLEIYEMPQWKVGTSIGDSPTSKIGRLLRMESSSFVHDRYDGLLRFANLRQICAHLTIPHDFVDWYRSSRVKKKDCLTLNDTLQ